VALKSGILRANGDSFAVFQRRNSFSVDPSLPRNPPILRDKPKDVPKTKKGDKIKDPKFGDIEAVELAVESIVNAISAEDYEANPQTMDLGIHDGAEGIYLKK
jgi:hypothetical protein